MNTTREVNLMNGKERTLITKTFPEAFESPLELNKKMDQADHIMEAFKDLIDLCGDNPNRDGLQETAYRVLKAFLEYT